MKAKLSLLTIILILPYMSLGNDLAISQGIAVPAMNHFSIVSNGFTFDNPVGASYQNSYKGTLLIDGTTSTSGGLDLGVGDSQYGF